eukprot:1158390-Pelagomonas_calceolata.AAC.4
MAATCIPNAIFCMCCLQLRSIEAEARAAQKELAAAKAAVVGAEGRMQKRGQDSRQPKRSKFALSEEAGCRSWQQPELSAWCGLYLWKVVWRCSLRGWLQAAEAHEAQVMAELRVMDDVTAERDQLSAQVHLGMEIGAMACVVASVAQKKCCDTQIKADHIPHRPPFGLI